MTRSVSRRLAVTLGVLTLLAGLLASVAGVALAATSTVQLNNNLFVPQNLGNIAAGDTITWQNVNGTHDVTSANIPAGAATWASPLLSGSATFSRTFTVAGNYRYLCTIHASVAEANAATQDPTKMVGQFTVVAGTTPTPTPTPPTPTPTPPTPTPTPPTPTPTPPTPTPTPTAESTPTPPPTDIATLSDSTSGNPPFLFVGIFLAALGLALLLTPARRRKR